MTRTGPEKNAEKIIRGMLDEAYPKNWHYKAFGGGMPNKNAPGFAAFSAQQIGIPDIVGCIVINGDNRFLGLEIKAYPNGFTETQFHNLKMIALNKGLACGMVARDGIIYYLDIMGIVKYQSGKQGCKAESMTTIIDSPSRLKELFEGSVAMFDIPGYDRLLEATIGEVSSSRRIKVELP
jgi:hypothetical protein